MADLETKAVPTDAADATLENMGYQQGTLHPTFNTPTEPLSTDNHRTQALVWSFGNDRVLILNCDLVRYISSLAYPTQQTASSETSRIQTLTDTCSWSALGGVLVTGVNAGGPPVMIWGWVGISLVSLCVAYSMAEMCSEYPVAGGQYSWVYIRQ